MNTQGKSKSLKDQYSYNTDMERDVPESQLPVFLASKALCEKFIDKCLVLTSHTKAFTISPKSISVRFVVIAVRLPHLAMSQESENLATKKHNSLLYNALCN